MEYGKAIRGYSKESGKYRVFGSNGPIGWHSTFLAPGPGVILGRKGAYRGVRFSKDPFFVIDTAYYLQPQTAIDMRWLYYATIYHRLGEIDDGSPIPSTTRAAVYVRPLEVPSVGEQRAIAQVLGTIDDRIEAIEKTNATLERVARTIFKSWFVDFDPVRAKAEGREPEGIDASTAALLPCEFDATHVQPIPEGWKFVPLDEMANFLNGIALQKYPALPGEEPLPAIKIAQLRRGSTEGADPISRSLPPKYLVKDGDILFSWSGSLEVEIWCGGDGALNQHLFKVTSSCYPQWFLYFWLREHLHHFREIAESKVTTMGHIQRHHLHDARVVVPPLDLLARLGETIAPLFEKVTQSRLQTRTLIELRDTLLPRLISGKLRLPEAEKLVEAVL